MDLAKYSTQRFRSADYVLKHRVAIDLLSQCQVFVAGPFFSSDAVVDVCSRRIPANHSTAVVKQRIVLNEKPPVLSIFAPDSLLVFEWHITRKRLQAFASQSRDIVWM